MKSLGYLPQNCLIMFILYLLYFVLTFVHISWNVAQYLHLYLY